MADDVSQSVAYREIFGLGESRGEANMTLRLLNRRCAPLSDATTAQIQPCSTSRVLQA
jgi:hypothetical protein